MKRNMTIGISILGVVIVVALLAIIVLPSRIEQHRKYAVLKSYAAQQFPSAASLAVSEAQTDCYGNSTQFSCPMVAYMLTSAQCLTAAQSVNPKAQDCDYRKTTSYKGHSIRVFMGATAAGGHALEVSLTDSGAH